MGKNNPNTTKSKLISDIRNLGNMEMFGPKTITKMNMFEHHPFFAELAAGLEKIKTEQGPAKQHIRSSINNIRGYIQSFDAAKEDIYGNASVSNELCRGSALVFDTAVITSGTEFYEPLGYVGMALNIAAAYVTTKSLSAENPNRTHLSDAAYDLKHEMDELLFRARDLMEDGSVSTHIRS